ATREVFEMMLGQELQLSQSPQQSGEVTAIVGLAGQLCGAFIVRCSAKAAVSMAAAMLGIEPEAVNQQHWDAVGEICNMTAGNFKAKLSGMGDGCMLSVPTVVSGADYMVRSLADGDAVTRTFLYEREPLCVSLEVHS
ncbi:MAG TPA: chemotaxis protein CheX, partial [Terriglobales bacterium]|nr:chemotaxis protein CheX [Terriglobales bacterium]